MARRGGEGGGMSAGPMNTIIAGFVGLLVVVAIVILGPTLAGSIEGATDNVDLGVESDWNATYNADLPSGADMWQTNVTIGGIVIHEIASRNRSGISRFIQKIKRKLAFISDSGYISVESFSLSPSRYTTSA